MDKLQLLAMIQASTGIGIGLITRVEVIDVGGIAAIQERRIGEGSVGILAGHVAIGL